MAESSRLTAQAPDLSGVGRRSIDEATWFNTEQRRRY
jgi:hypothetical protein